MNRFEKGASYLAITVNATGGKKGWLVQQTGQKSWVATQFTTCITDHDGSYSVILGNGIKVYRELDDLSNVADLEVMKVRDNASMRHTMFNILKRGSFYDS